MAQHNHTQFLELLHCFLPAAALTALAKAHGWFQRQREFEPVMMVWTLILGFSGGAQRSLAALHRAYQRHSGSDASYAAFYQRLDQSLLDTMQSVFKTLLRPNSTTLGAFEDILALDATLVRLWDALAPKFASTAQGQAAAKLHVVMSVASLTTQRVKLRQGREHDTCAWRTMGDWVKGRLLLIDLGYYNFWLFHRIHAHQGYFLSRLKTNCALLISKDLRTGAGRRAQVQGQKLCEVLKRLKSKHFEFEVEVPVELRSGRIITYRWRALGEFNEETGKYHVYLTNAPATMIEVEDARQLYALRWQVELLFRALKECGRLHQLPSRKAVIVKLLILGALCWACLAGWLRQALIPKGERFKIGVLRTARLLREWGDELLGALASERESFQPRQTLELFGRQLRDPNDMRVRSLAIPALVDAYQGFTA